MEQLTKIPQQAPILPIPPLVLERVVVTTDHVDKLNIHNLAFLLRESIIREIVFDADNLQEDNLRIMCEQLTQHPTLRKVVFTGSLFNNVDLHHITAMIRQSRSIISLAIDNNVFGLCHQGMTPLIAAIRDNRKIREFGITNCTMDHLTVRALSEMIRHSKSINVFSLSGCTLELRDVECISAALVQNEIILGVDFSNTNIADDSVEFIANIIKDCKQLKKLCLINTRISEPTMERLKLLVQAVKGGGSAETSSSD